MIAGTNIYLRDPVIEDLEYFLTWHNDRELKKQAMMPPFIVTSNEEKQWLERLISSADKKRKTFIIIDKNDKMPIGYTQFRDINTINKNAKFGIVIGNRLKQGKGFGEEIVNLMVRFAFEELNLQKISLEVIEENQRAIQLYLKMGFFKEGYLIRQFLYEGNYYNVVLMAHLK